MNLFKDIPVMQEEKVLENIMFRLYAFSKQGNSHKERNLPCQDYYGYRFLENERIFIAAVADGVGSCKLSHWGAYFAVNVVLDSIEKRVIDMLSKDLQSINNNIDSFVLNSLYWGFRDVKGYLSDVADNADVHELALATTLTVVVYDGKNLFFGSVGDSGVLVKHDNHEFELITKQNRGASVNSTYPLQAGESYWSFGKYNKFVDEFIVATDGLLDDALNNSNSVLAIIGNYIIPKIDEDTSKNYVNEVISTTSLQDDLTMIYVKRRS